MAADDGEDGRVEGLCFAENVLGRIDLDGQGGHRHQVGAEIRQGAA